MAQRLKHGENERHVAFLIMVVVPQKMGVNSVKPSVKP
jgi:hypothetical protein